MAFLNKGLEIVVRDERDRRPRRSPTRSPTAPSTPSVDRGRRRPTAPRADERRARAAVQYDRGLVDYVEHLNRRKDQAHPSVIDFEAELPDSRA